MAVKGTFEQRQAARAEQALARQTRFYIDKICGARNGREQVQQATDYAKAVAADLDDTGRRRLAAAIAKAVEDTRRDYGQ